MRRGEAEARMKGNEGTVKAVAIRQGYGKRMSNHPTAPLPIADHKDDYGQEMGTFRLGLRS